MPGNAHAHVRAHVRVRPPTKTEALDADYHSGLNVLHPSKIAVFTVMLRSDAILCHR